MATNAAQPQPNEPIDRGRLVQSVGVSLLVFVVFLFIPAGTWSWFKGWLFLGAIIAASIPITVYLRRVNPDVVAGRINRHRGTKRWDLVLAMIFVLPSMLAILIVAGLDDGRFHWFPLPIWACVVGYVLLGIGFAGVTWAEAVNKFFEPSVRIQTERGHRVVDSGPYAFVRHPGYLSGFFIFIGMPLCLGSVWALIPAIVVCLLMVVRTVFEDQMLRDELPGYFDYARRTRYRLIPGVW